MGTKGDTKLVKTYVDADTKALLKEQAAREQRSVAFVLRRLIVEGLAKASA